MALSTALRTALSTALGMPLGSVRVGAFIGRRMMAVQDVKDNADGMSTAAAAALLSVESDQRYIAAMPVHTFTAKWWKEPKPGVYVYDFEQNLSGWIKLMLKYCAAGTRIQFRHAELLHAPLHVREEAFHLGWVATCDPEASREGP